MKNLKIILLTTLLLLIFSLFSCVSQSVYDEATQQALTLQEEVQALTAENAALQQENKELYQLKEKLIKLEMQTEQSDPQKIEILEEKVVLLKEINQVLESQVKYMKKSMFKQAMGEQF